MIFEGLTVYRSQEVVVGSTTWKIYEFAKGDPKRPHPTNELAVLTLKGEVVSLNYYPCDGRLVQVYQDLSTKDIKEALDYIKSKGFE